MEKPKKKNWRGFESSDLLRALPEGILLHILSLLPYKSAVATSTLSRHWRRLWEMRLPNRCCLRLVDPYGGPTPEELVAAFNRCIELHSPPRRLDTLIISFRPLTAHFTHLRRWMKYARECGVADLCLELPPPRRSKFVFYYQSPSLVRLTLTGVHITRTRSYRNLTSLEVLSLHQVHISDAPLEKLITSCRKLRVLELHGCMDLRSIHIISPPVCDEITNVRVVACSSLHTIRLTVPKLRSFCVRNTPLSNMALWGSALEDVYMSWGWGWSRSLPSHDHPWDPTKAFTPIQFLTVGGAQLKLMASWWRHTPVALQNLRELQILMPKTTADGYLEQMYTIYSFLRNVLCPSLEKLFIELPLTYSGPNLGMLLTLGEKEPPPLEGVSFEHLRIIKMKNFTGVSTEMQLVKFFLKKAIHLESMIVVAADAITKSSTNQKYDRAGEMRLPNPSCLRLWKKYDRAGEIYFLRQQLELLPKTSTTATLLFYEFDDDLVQPRHHEVQNASCRIHGWRLVCSYSRD